MMDTQGLLIPADAVSTPYSYRTCAVYNTPEYGDTYCSEYLINEVESASLVPPFTYNNQCGSVVLTSYIPVLLLGYSIQLMLPFIFMTSLTFVSYDSMPPSVRKMFHGIIWPEYWLQGGDVLVRNTAILNSDPSVLLEIETICCNDVLNNWLLMLTFGLCSPVLAVAIVCSVLLKMSLWMSLVGRFTRSILPGDGGGGDGSNATSPPAAGTTAVGPFPSRLSETVSRRSVVNNKNTDDVVHFALTALAEVHIPLFEVLSRSFWRLIWCSALFVALLGWDMAGDEVGLLQSLWVPLAPLGYALVLRCGAHY
jgi:hypothetical protein